MWRWTEEAERPKQALSVDANRRAKYVHPQSPVAEGRSRERRMVPLPVHEDRSVQEKLPMEQLARLKAGYSRAWHPQPVPSWRSQAVNLARVPDSGFAWVHCLLLVVEHLLKADIRIPMALPYPHDRAVRNETRVDRWL